MKRRKNFDPTTLEIYRALYTSVAEEMGLTLRRTAHSPNIKERRDYSCAVFDRARQSHRAGRPHARPPRLDADGRRRRAPRDAARARRRGRPQRPLRGRHAPAGRDARRGRLSRGAGGRGPGAGEKKEGCTEAVVPSGEVSLPRPPAPDPRPLFYVANRAHHADIGGATPGSMGLAVDVYGEGLRIPPVHLVRGGRVVEDVMRLVLANVRVEAERRADFEAQVGSLKTGASRLLEIVARSGASEATEYAAHLIEYSSRMMRAAIGAIPDGVYEAEDALDSDGVGDGEITLRVRVEISGTSARRGLRGERAAGRGACERGRGDHGLGGRVRLPLPRRRRGGARERGADGADRSRRAARLGRQRGAPGVGRGRERRDLAAHRRCAVQGSGAGAAPKHPGGESGHDEQPDHRRHRPAQRCASSPTTRRSRAAWARAPRATAWAASTRT